MKLKEITDCLEAFTPLAYQESYDNAGLICGNHNMDIKGALICLDSTEAIIDEAIANGCNLVIAHHPIIFSGLKKITGKNYVERVIIKAIQNNIAIYAAHTNLDNVHCGVNAQIAKKLGLINCKILAPSSNAGLKKLITFCPEANAEAIRTALFVAGAGHIANYDQCSFNTPGTGTFRAGEGTTPFVGKQGQQHRENELRIETIYPQHIESALIKALLKAHPYEEVAYDLVSLTNTNNRIGAGLIGELTSETDEMLFLKQLKTLMNTDSIRYTALRDKKIKKIAVCGGSGSFLLGDAIKNGAELFITSDFKYHQFFDAENHIVIADIGHYETEQFTMELFYDILKEKFSTFAFLITKINTNPIKYL